MYLLYASSIQMSDAIKQYLAGRQWTSTGLIFYRPFFVFVPKNKLLHRCLWYCSRNNRFYQTVKTTGRWYYPLSASTLSAWYICTTGYLYMYDELLLPHTLVVYTFSRFNLNIASKLLQGTTLTSSGSRTHSMFYGIIHYSKEILFYVT